jgi:hypothetical protein
MKKQKRLSDAEIRAGMDGLFNKLFKTAEEKKYANSKNICLKENREKK